MKHPDASHTLFHGKIGVFLTGMKKLMIYFCQVYLADMQNTGQVLVLVLLQHTEVCCALLRHLRSFRPESGALMPLAIFPSQISILSSVLPFLPGMPPRELKAERGPLINGWKLHQLHILESTLGPLHMESPK